MRTDSRTPLKQNTELHVTNHQKGQMVYVIQQEIGRGGSCIVYSGYYSDNTGTGRPVRIKECYPYGLKILRGKSGELIVDGEDAGTYEKFRKRMKSAFAAGNELFETSGLTNSVSNSVDLYEANNTSYIVSAYLEGETLSFKLCGSLKDAVAIVKSMADAIRKIHAKGYLYLDIKPENVFILKNITELVVLFDFDSLISWEEQEEIEKNQVFYTKGFAAPELKTGRLDHIGKHTDVYGVGALLFYLIFGRVPQALDCDINVRYDYGKWRYAQFHYRDKLYYMLSDFFHHTLAAFYGDRYEDLDEAVRKLTEIEKLTDVSQPFICDSYIPEKVYMAGREAEEEQLYHWMSDRRKKCLFVTGMGGIGKSTLVRGCISKNRTDFDTVLYLYYNGSIRDMITDDIQLYVNTLEKMEEERNSDYFKRKLFFLRKLVANTNTLLVIDNFDGKIEEDFLQVLQVGWKLAVITRNEMKGAAKEYETLKVGKIRDTVALQELIAESLGRCIEDDEKTWMELLIEELHSHTLVLELFAKQMAKSCMTAQEAFILVKENGFASLASEKVDYIKDGKLYYEKLSKVITALFSAEKMPGEKKMLLRMLSLFDMPGIGIADFQEMLNFPHRDFIYELQEERWLLLADGYLSLHPVIRETVRQWEWSMEYQDPGLCILRYLSEKMSLEGRREDYYLRLSENVLVSLERDSVLRDMEEYDDLLYCTIMKMPRDRENFILKHSEELLYKASLKGYGKDTKGNEGAAEKQGAGRRDCLKAEVIIRMCDYVVFLLCEKREFKLAREKLKLCEELAARHNNDYLWGLYYSILSQYYDALLNGAYLALSKEEKRILRCMLQAGSSAVRYMKRSKQPDAGQCLARYMIDKANLLIRSRSGRKRKIRSLINGAQEQIKKYEQEDLEICQSYYLSLAWFYTFYERDYKRMSEALQKAYETARKRECSSLDLIDYILIPTADILSQWMLHELSIVSLETALELCEEYPGYLPYIRKKMDLYGYMLDVYLEVRDFEQCRRILVAIDEENEKNNWTGIVKKVPQEIREAVLKGSD